MANAMLKAPPSNHQPPVASSGAYIASNPPATPKGRAIQVTVAGENEENAFNTGWRAASHRLRIFSRAMSKPRLSGCYGLWG